MGVARRFDRDGTEIGEDDERRHADDGSAEGDRRIAWRRHGERAGRAASRSAAVGRIAMIVRRATGMISGIDAFSAKDVAEMVERERSGVRAD